MNKKSSSTKKTTEMELIKKVLDALKSPALNGGFDTLLRKIDSIERSQDHTSRTVDDISAQHVEIKDKIASIHSAIYDPDNGLFARQHAAEARHDVANADLTLWKKSIEKDINRDEQSDEQIWKRLSEQETKTSEINNKIDIIVTSRKNIRSVLKWVIVSLGSGGIALIMKLIYDIITKFS